MAHWRHFDVKPADPTPVDLDLPLQTQEKALLVGHLNTIIREVTKNKEARLRSLEERLQASGTTPVAADISGAVAVPAKPAIDTRDLFEGFDAPAPA